jgi:hypothetical protein
MPNYMVYQGKTRHCWKGRCIYGSQPKWSVFSLFFFNIPPIVLFSTLTPVSHTIDMHQIFADEENTAAITSILIFLQAATLIFYIATVCSNPGIIPRSVRLRVVICV